ncbi:MAG: NAD(P)/FAD-dependent oxidoreductase [Flavisolibacter sp.]|nr:NAD(P)/FAD-dependent oxidoreductase [Flavisolibacter sp.]
MKQTGTLIVGASVSGLALAASLQKQGIEYIIIEKQSQIASPWRHHYDRLHLHTNKRVSNLPYKKFDSKIPRYPTRQQVVEYLEDYQRTFNIHPAFKTEAKAIRKESDYWVTETNNETLKSKYLIMATGAFGNPKPVYCEGMETFPGRIMHSCEYKTGKDFKGQRVLVVGFGNSACEIAIDLYEQGAMPCMSVRSPVNIIPRDVAGIPILELSLIMSRLPPRVADTINAPLMRLIFGDIRKLGLKKMPYGPFEEIKKDRNIPVLDIGTIKHIRKGQIKVSGGIDHIEGNTVHFSDGKKEDFDVIVACIGFNRDNAEIITVDKNRFEDLNICVDKQKYFGKDGLYFCGFWVGPTGHIREIAADAQKIAKDIAKKESLSKNYV